MNARIKQLLKQAQNVTAENHVPGGSDYEREIYVTFAELIVQECVNALEFHGFDEAVPYIKWMATNKLEVKQ